MLADLIIASYFIIKLMIECRYQEISVNRIVAIHTFNSSYEKLFKRKNDYQNNIKQILYMKRNYLMLKLFKD